jgi:hypothetical protein
MLEYTRRKHMKRNKVVKEFYFYFKRDSNCIPTNNIQWKTKAMKKICQLGPKFHSPHLRKNVQQEKVPVRKRLKRQNNSNFRNQSPDMNSSDNCYVIPNSLLQ